MLEMGLTSVTFRNLACKEVIEYCKNAGVSYIEWGSDIHIPPDNFENAKIIKALTVNANIKISSYGSYYKIGEHENYKEVFSNYLKTAQILSAPTIRIWAGNTSSTNITKEQYEEFIKEVKCICHMAKEFNICPAFEFHHNTLVDTADSALSVIKDADCENLGLYFQFDPLVSIEENCRTLEKLLPFLKMIHVFNIDKSFNRLLLEEEYGLDMWRKFVSILKRNNISVILLIEFLKNPSFEGLKKELKTLKSIID